MIEVSDLTKTYGPRTAVNGISFSVPRGQVLGFLGPNGAGKSTTMRILTGYLSATSGRASIAGFDVFDHPLEVRRRVGYLPENNPLYNEMRVAEFLKLCCRIRGVPPRRRRARIEYALEACGLTDRRREIIGRLSKGLRQRVGLAQAVVHDPDLLILDEPTSGLDPAQTRETRDLIVALGKAHTVILSSHILPEVSATCQRVVIINRGVLVADDRPDSLARRMSAGKGMDIEVVVRGVPADVRRRVESIKAAHVEDIAEITTGFSRIRVHTEGDADLREELAKALVRGGFGLLELHARNLSLEDVFISLTTEEPQTWPPA
ncbi:MAG: ABC transporter ATP-binding protein [Candidatus Dormibacteraceae bacterium]